jgi:hypothetical protein
MWLTGTSRVWHVARSPGLSRLAVNTHALQTGMSVLLSVEMFSMFISLPPDALKQSVEDAGQLL